MKTPKEINVLVACEESQAVTIAFRKRGFNALSCDLLPCSGGHPQWHLQGDAFNYLMHNRWHLVIAHPPCTRLANSGVRWLNERNLWGEMYDAAAFFNIFLLYGRKGYKIAIENPIPHKHALLPKYNQIIQPWQFGHGETKATCLWLFGLPKLEPTNIVEGRDGKVWKMGPSKDRAKLRSKTYPGIAEAMAEQWGNYLITTL
jgi:hypothetical protein